MWPPAPRLRVCVLSCPNLRFGQTLVCSLLSQRCRVPSSRRGGQHASLITSAALVFVVWPTNSTRLVAVWQREETGLESIYYGEQVTDTEMG